MRVVAACVVLATVVAGLAVAPAGDVRADPGPSGWGGHGGWHGGHGGGHQNNGGVNGTVVVDPYPDAPYPYPYPGPGPGEPVAGQDASTIPPPMPVWYFCDKPNGYYPYVKTCAGDWQSLQPTPPPPGAGPPLSEDSWDYCDDTKAYYPYVATCKHHWIAMPATLPEVEMPMDRPPAIAMWFYCTEPKGYYPYVHDCPQTWKMTPSMPPASLTPAPKNTAAVP